MTPRRLLYLAVALIVVLGGVFVQERQRAGITITETRVGETPVTVFGADGPAVVVAHGFAGSRQMMQGYALTLAQAGYRVFTFDFEGHGRHPVPMSGDVNSIDGTTRLLVDQTLSVVAAAGGEERVALLGHSMATDILVRAALAAPDRIGPLVLVSAFSQAIDATHPADTLFITGAWEGGLRAFALQAVAMVDPAAGEGDVARAGDVRRMAVAAPFSEHVGVLHSRTGREAAVDWLNVYFGCDVTVPVPPTGPWILALLFGLVALAAPVAWLLPRHPDPVRAMPGPGGFAAAVLLPALIAPPLAVLADPGVLPVLVADHLAIHLALYGLIQLAVLRWLGVAFGPVRPVATLAVLIWGLGVLGLMLDRYAASFWPIPERLPIIAALALGAVPFMISDALVTDGGRAGLSRRVLARVAFLGSLGLAVALDFEGLFFLLMIAPVVVLFYAVFGLLGRWVARRQGAMGAGLGLGLCLAWALGVSFPMFLATG